LTKRSFLEISSTPEPVAICRSPGVPLPEWDYEGMTVCSTGLGGWNKTVPFVQPNFFLPAFPI
jgi:hypothetical protein